jgi:hypothetical protein
MDILKVSSYHEAAHVTVGWVLGIPIGDVVISANGKEGRVRKSLWYRLTRAWQKVSQDTVRQDIMWSLAGKYGEMLAGEFTAMPHDFDFYFLDRLARRFALDMETLERDTWNIVFAQRGTIVRLAHEFAKRRKLSEHDIAVLRMDWLARGESGGLPLTTI